MNRRDFIKTTVGAGAAFGVMRASSATGATEPAAPPPPFPKTAGLTRQVAEFVVGSAYADLPADVIELGKKSILDGLGLAIGGSKTKPGELIRAYIASLGPEGRDGATVIGTPRRFTPRFAALANGISEHVDDFDDTQLSSAPDRVYGLLVHPTVCVLPAILAASESVGTSGKDFMLAYHVGVEVECKIAEAISPRHYQDGFHSTGTCGVFGGAAGCAKARGFDADRTVTTLAIAASHAAGLRENFGTMMKPFQAGHAAESGVVAADLAALGWSGAPQILEAGNGFFHAYGGTYEPSAIDGKLGKPWTFSSPGISIKPFPSGSLTHPGMTELLRMIEREGIHAGDVVQVEVGTNRNMPNTLIHHRPKNGLQAKFSMEYCMAVLLVEGRAGLAQFTDSVVNRPDLQEMVAKVRFYTDPEAERAGYDKMTTILKVHLKDGRVIPGRADFGKGSPADPMSFDEVSEKFRGCAAYAGWPAAKAEKIVKFTARLEEAPDIRELLALCSG